MTPATGMPPPAAPCPSWQDDLKAFVDGELPLVRRVTLQRHLSGCADCRAEVEAMQRIGQSLRRSEGTDTASASVLDPALRSRILAAMQDAAASSAGAPDEAAPHTRLRSSRPAFRFGPTSAFALAALALFVAIVTTPLMTSLREQTGTSTFSAEKSAQDGVTAASGAAAAPSATGAMPSGGFAAPGAASTAAEEAPEAAKGHSTGSVARMRPESMKAGTPPASPSADAADTTTGGPMAQTAKQPAAARRPAADSERNAETAAPGSSAGRQGRKAAGAALTITTETVPVPHTESLTLTVTRLEDSAREVERLARLSEGTLTSRAAVYAQEDSSGGRSERKTQIILSLQLPAGQADDFITRLSEIGQVTERQTEAPAIPQEQQQRRRQGAATTDVKVLLQEK